MRNARLGAFLLLSACMFHSLFFQRRKKKPKQQNSDELYDL